MLKTHVSRLLATGAASAALAAGGLAIITTPAHAAGAAAATYSCDGLGAVPVSYSLPALPATALAGVPIAAQPVNASLTLPAGASQYRTGTVDMLVGVGFGHVATPLGGSTPISSGVLNVAGTLGSITPGFAGQVPIAFPKSFTLSLQGASGAPVSYTCSQGTEPAAGTIQVSQQTASVQATPVKKTVKASKNPEVSVQVTRQFGNPTGKVYAIWKGQTVGKGKLRLAGGPVMLTLGKLAPGSYKIKIRYEGDPATKAATKNVQLTVTR